MFWLAIMGVTLVGLAASQQKCAKAGGRARMAKASAMRRVPPNLRKKMRKPARPAVGGEALALPRRAPVYCEKLPWLDREVDAAFEAGLEAGLTGEDLLTGFVLHEVYHVTHDGEPIPWPAMPQDSPSLRALQERVRIRVRRHLAVLSDLRAHEHYEGE